MKRIAEPELMNDPAQVHAYAIADFAQPHDHFIESLLDTFPELLPDSCGYALDLGCGPADISRRFANALSEFEIHAVDAAENMIAMATRLNQQQGLQQRIKCQTAFIHDVDTSGPDYDIIFSNSLLHHLNKPLDLWNAIIRIASAGTRIFIMDLMRPANTAQAHELVQHYAANEPEILQHDFYRSLCAAYRIDEIQQQLLECHLHYCQIRAISDRHVIIYGRKP